MAIAYDPILAQLSGLGYHAVNSGGYSPVTGSGTGSVTLTGATSEHKAYSYFPVFSGSSITGLELGVSSNTKAAASAASAQAGLTQIGVNHLRKRLGDLRESLESEDGAWVRAYSGNVTNDKYGEVASDYKGMQLGYDQSTPVKSGRKYTGAAFSYTGAGNSFRRGGGDSKAYDFALYQTWIGKNGQYYDVIAKRGRLSSDYHVTDLSDNYSTADYKTWTDSLSAEYGVRKQLTNGWYIEPQAELTFGRVKGVDYTTSSG